jgi:ABC-type branched-subunit amino acid transport system ATPase component
VSALAGAANAPAPVLEVSDVVRAYGGLRAVDGATFEVRAGTITGLIGPNGAGKSTMLGIIAGAIAADSGRVTAFGQPCRPPAHNVARLGVGRTFQIPQEFGRLTVLENLMAAPLGQVGEGVWTALFGSARWRRQEREMLDRAWSLLHRFRLLAQAHEYARNLSGGQKKLLELARALMATPRLMLLDEPMAGVNPALVGQLEEHIASLRAEGVTMLMVEHEMGVVERLCDHVIVMAQGKVLAEGSFADIRADARVIEAYLGA